MQFATVIIPIRISGVDSLVSKNSQPSTKNSQLLLFPRLLANFDFLRHPKIGVGDLLTVWLGIGRGRHLAMENITTGAEILPQPDHSLQIVTVEHTAYGDR